MAGESRPLARGLKRDTPVRGTATVAQYASQLSEPLVAALRRTLLLLKARRWEVVSIVKALISKLLSGLTESMCDIQSHLEGPGGRNDN